MKRSPILFLLFALLALGLLVAAVPAQAKGGPPAVEGSIVDTAIAVNQQTGEFETLIAAVVCADLAEPLDARGQYTVFAPTDAAFGAAGLDAESVCNLPTEALRDILLYHVARGERPAADVVSSEQIRMMNGDFTDITVNAGGVLINDAQIVVTDVFATNGVIHVITGVLLPPN